MTDHAAQVLHGTDPATKRVVILWMRCGSCGVAVEKPAQWRKGGSCAGCQDDRAWQFGLEKTATEAINPETALRQMWFQLIGHCKDEGDSPIDTLNRLIAKHLAGRFPGEDRMAPTFGEADLQAQLEWWSTRSIESLWQKHTRKEPGLGKGPPELIKLPVIVLSHDAMDCLIDGTTRTNKRLDTGMPEPHPVYLLSRAG